MNTLIFKSSPDQNERHELIDRINRLEPEQTLVLRAEQPLDPLLNELKRKRFKGLSWITRGQPTSLEIVIQNESPEDCCGCCGGS